MITIKRGVGGLCAYAQDYNVSNIKHFVTPCLNSKPDLCRAEARVTCDIDILMNNHPLPIPVPGKAWQISEP